jgi:hypothetical protein
VLQLLGAASAAAVHSLSLPAMLLAGDGDVSRGMVCTVREAVARTGRGQLLVLYLPRIEVSWHEWMQWPDHCAAYWVLSCSSKPK